jgi:hypothetical protein
MNRMLLNIKLDAVSISSQPRAQRGFTINGGAVELVHGEFMRRGRGQKGVVGFGH